MGSWVAPAHPCCRILKTSQAFYSRYRRIQEKYKNSSQYQGETKEQNYKWSPWLKIKAIICDSDWFLIRVIKCVIYDMFVLLLKHIISHFQFARNYLDDVDVRIWWCLQYWFAAWHFFQQQALCNAARIRLSHLGSRWKNNEKCEERKLVSNILPWCFLFLVFLIFLPTSARLHNNFCWCFKCFYSSVWRGMIKRVGLDNVNFLDFNRWQTYTKNAKNGKFSGLSFLVSIGYSPLTICFPRSWVFWRITQFIC